MSCPNCHNSLYDYHMQKCAACGHKYKIAPTQEAKANDQNPIIGLAQYLLLLAAGVLLLFLIDGGPW